MTPVRSRMVGGRGRLPLTHLKDKEMTKQDQNERIDQAITLLKEVARVQSRDKEFCPTCQAPEYTDWVSFQLAESLDGIVRKLRKLKWGELDGEAMRRAPGRRSS